ncbi:MAG: ChuX/HutX family heme-like substrate-binding protein [Bacteroidota bacterium]
MKNIEDLRKSYERVKLENPKMRNRDVAKAMGISELELLALSIGKHVVLLEGSWKDLLKGVINMGHVMALTRNEHVVHERKGVYDNITFYEGFHNMGVAVNPDIDLRFFMNEWKYGLAVTMERGPKFPTLFSFQFFNSRGEAVHKIYSTPKSNLNAYHELVEKFKAPEQEFSWDVDPSPYPPKEEKLDEEIDVQGFQQAWLDLQDTHHFFGMLKKYKVTRIQALRLAPEGHTQQVPNESVVRMLQEAADQKLPIMVFVHSKGCVQIHTGEVRHLKQIEDWYNVLDPQFNLHLKMNSIKESWIVKKPTEDGIVTSLELFDENGDLIVYFFGKRKPGIPELTEWRELVKELSMVSTA